MQVATQTSQSTHSVGRGVRSRGGPRRISPEQVEGEETKSNSKDDQGKEQIQEIALPGTKGQPKQNNGQGK